MIARKLPPIVASLVLLAYATTMFFPALFQGKIIAPLDITTCLYAPWNQTASGAKPHNHSSSDAVTQYLPYRIFAEKSLREDGYIGWNPYEMGGYSLAGNTMALPGSWAMQLHRVLPFKDAWNLGIMAEFLIAGSGMLVFLRRRALPWLPCLIGAVAYMANSQFIIWIYHRWALGSFCWMPWVLWSVAGGFQWRAPTTRQLLLPGFLALAILGGSLQHFAFVVLACGCVFLGGITNWKSPNKEWPAIVGWTLAFALALVMTSFTLIPQISAYFSNLAVGQVRGGLGYSEGLWQPVFNTLLIPLQIWPWLAGDPQTINGFRLIQSDFMDLAYLGTIPMVLALLGLFYKGMPRQAKWLILAGLLIPLTPLVGPLYHRVQLLFLLGGSWMAAEMLACLSANAAPRLIRGFSVIVVALGAALLIGTCLPAPLRGAIDRQVVVQSIAASDTSQFGSDKAWIERRAHNWTSRFSFENPRTAWIYGLLVLGSAGLILCSRGNPVAVRWGHVAVLGATSFELLTLFQTWTTFSDPSDLLPGHPALERVAELAGPHRVLQRGLGSPLVDIFATPNLLAAHCIPSVDSYESIQYRSMMTALAGEAPETRLTLAGVGISVQSVAASAQPGTAAWPIIETISGYEIRKNPGVAAPLVSGMGQPPHTAAEILASLSSAIPVIPNRQTMNRIAFDVPAGSTWVRLSQNWHAGWRWTTPGHDWQAFRNGSDAACWIDALPTGSRHIDVQFFPRPRWLEYTSMGTALAWLCLLPVFRLFSRAVTQDVRPQLPPGGALPPGARATE